MALASNRKWYFLQLFFAAAGALTSLYLLVHHNRLKSGIQDSSSLCSFGPYADCNAVNSSAFAEVLGVPVAAAGVLYFLLLFLLGLFQPPHSKGFERTQAWMAWLALLALSVDLWLTGVQAFVLQSFCLFCVFTYVCTAAHLALNWAMAPKDRKKGLRFLRSDKRSKIPPFVGAGTFSLLAIGAVGLYSLSAGPAPRVGAEEAKRAFLASWDSLPSAPIALRVSDSQWGNPQAKVQIVLFSDFECPHCQRAAFAVQTALASEKDRISLVFKHFPLDMSCNRLLTQPIHANACALAQLGQCAQKKGKFWDYHDRVFFKLSARELSSTRDKIWEGVRSVFTREEFDRCLADPEAAANIQADIEQGNVLGVTSTPSVFINGKKVTLAPTVDLLRDLVKKELK